MMAKSKAVEKYVDSCGKNLWLAIWNRYNTLTHKEMEVITKKRA